jgi:hypothetical protein
MSKIKFEKTFTKKQCELLKDLFGFEITQINDKSYVHEEQGVLLIVPRQTNEYPYPNNEDDLSGGFDGRFIKRAVEILEELLKDKLQAVYTGPTATPMIFLGKRFEIHLAPKKGKKTRKPNKEEDNDVKN